MSNNDITNNWRKLLIEIVLAYNYPVAFRLTSAGGAAPPRNPILEYVLPSLLHLKAVAILDAALAAVSVKVVVA